MDRAQLKYLLNSGPSRILDVRKLHFEQKLVPLFKCGILNSTILIKQSGAQDLADYEDLPPIATKVYMPYDRKKPEVRTVRLRLPEPGADLSSSQ